MVRVINNSADKAAGETSPRRPFNMRIVTDPVEIAEARRQRDQFKRNSNWQQAHVKEIYANYRGRHICVAGEELFDGVTAREAIDKAKAAHPDDKGHFLLYIPKERLPRIYAF